MDGTLMKKDGRHTSDIGSWKLAGPVGCEVRGEGVVTLAVGSTLLKFAG